MNRSSTMSRQKAMVVLEVTAAEADDEKVVKAKYRRLALKWCAPLHALSFSPEPHSSASIHHR